jgi:hypothetical protein
MTPLVRDDTACQRFVDHLPVPGVIEPIHHHAIEARQLSDGVDCHGAELGRAVRALQPRQRGAQSRSQSGSSGA